MLDMSALCVECDAELNIGGRVRLGQHIICPNCGVQLEVISTHPIEVDVAYDESEEWDDLDGYGLDDEEDDDELEGYARLEGAKRGSPADLEEDEFADENKLDGLDEEDDDLLDRD
jgi:alpha-aminoadipate carrier protein LysW